MTEQEWEKAEQRMNVIGQNGNDGLHYDTPCDIPASQTSEAEKLALDEYLKNMDRLPPDTATALRVVQGEINSILLQQGSELKAWSSIEAFAGAMKDKIQIEAKREG